MASVYLFDSSTQGSFTKEIASSNNKVSAIKTLLEECNMFRTGLVYGIGNGENSDDPIITLSHADFQINPDRILPDYPTYIVSANISKSNHGSSRNGYYDYIKQHNLQNDPAFGGVNFTRAKNDVLESVIQKHRNTIETLKLKEEGEAQMEFENVQDNAKQEALMNTMAEAFDITKKVESDPSDFAQLTLGEMMDAALTLHIRQEVALKTIALEERIAVLEKKNAQLQVRIQALSMSK